MRASGPRLPLAAVLGDVGTAVRRCGVCILLLAVLCLGPGLWLRYGVLPTSLDFENLLRWGMLPVVFGEHVLTGALTGLLLATAGGTMRRRALVGALATAARTLPVAGVVTGLDCLPMALRPSVLEWTAPDYDDADVKLAFLLGQIVYMAWIYPRLWLAVPVAGVERLGLLAAWRRSGELGRGQQLRILLLALLAFAVVWLAGQPLRLVRESLSVDTERLVLAVLCAALAIAFGLLGNCILFRLKSTHDVDPGRLAAPF